MARETLTIAIEETGAAKATQGVREIGVEGERSAKKVNVLKKIMRGIGATLVIRQLGRTADSYRNISNRIATVTKSHEEAATVMERVFKIANDTRQSFEATGIVYARVANAATDLGKSHEEVLSLVKGLNQAMAVGGTTSREANAALIQFSQGLASGTLRGDELRSVLEQSVVVSEVLSRGLGVTRGELKKMGEAGKISSQLIFESFSKMEAELEERFAELVPTLSQSFEVFKNHFIKFIGEINEAQGVTMALGKALKFLANNLVTVVKLLALLGARFAIKKFLPLVVAFATKLPAALKSFGFAFNMYVLNPMLAFQALLRIIPTAIGLLVAFSDKISIATPSGGLGVTDPFAGNVMEAAQATAKKKGTDVGTEFTKGLNQAIKRGGKEVEKVLSGKGSVWEKANATGKKAMLRDHRQAWEDIKEITKKEGKEAGAAAGKAYADSFKKSPSMKLSSFFAALWDKIKDGASNLSDDITEIFGSFGVDVKISFRSVALFIADMWDGLVKITKVIAHTLYIFFDVAFHNIKEVAKRTWKWLKEAAQSAEFNILGTGAAPESTGDRRGIHLKQAQENLKEFQAELESAKVLQKVSTEARNRLLKAAGKGPLDVFETASLKDAMRDLDAANESIRQLTDTLDKTNNVSTGHITDTIAEIAKGQKDLKDNPLDTGDGYRSAYKEVADSFVDIMTSAGGARTAMLGVFDAGEKLEQQKKRKANLDEKGKDKTSADTAGLKKLLKAWRKLEDQLKPVTAAEREFAESTAILDKVFKLGKISVSEYNNLLATLKSQLDEAMNPLSTWLAAQREENELLGLSEEKRARAIEMRGLEAELIGKSEFFARLWLGTIGHELDLRDQQIAKNAIIKKQREEEAAILKSIKGPQEEYTKNLRALDANLANNKVNAEEYALALAKIQLVLLDTKLDEGSGIERALIRIKTEIVDLASATDRVITTFFSSFESMVVDTVTGFTDGWEAGLENMENAFKSFVDTMLAEMTRLLFRMALFEAFGGALGVPTSAPIGVDTSKLPHHQHGGQFRVGGAGGPDSQLVQFMASPNETVTVATPGQQAAAAPAPAPIINLKVVNVTSAKQTVEDMDTPEGGRVIMNHLQQNQAAVRRLAR